MKSTKDMKRILIALVPVTVILAVTLLAQGRGTPSQIRVKIDANGALLTASAAQVNPVNSVQFNNARLSVDSSGNLLTVSSGGVSNPVTVPQGGTGAVTLTNHGVLLGQGTSTVVATSAGTLGQFLVSQGASADPIFKTPTATQNSTGSPFSTSSTAALVMAGAAMTITPTSSGRVLFIVSGACENSIATDGCSGKLSYGTGTAPVNGAALTGTQVGNFFNVTSTGAAQKVGMSRQAVVTGLTVNTAYWFDLAFEAITAGQASLTNIDGVAIEF